MQIFKLNELIQLKFLVFILNFRTSFLRKKIHDQNLCLSLIHDVIVIIMKPTLTWSAQLAHIKGSRGKKQVFKLNQHFYSSYHLRWYEFVKYFGDSERCGTKCDCVLVLIDFSYTSYCSKMNQFVVNHACLCACRSFVLLCVHLNDFCLNGHRKRVHLNQISCWHVITWK